MAIGKLSTASATPSVSVTSPPGQHLRHRHSNYHRIINDEINPEEEL